MITEEDIRKEYVSANDATELLDVNDSRIRQILRAGRLPGAFKFADTWLIPRKSIDGYTRLKPGVKPKAKNKEIILNALQQNIAGIRKDEM